MVIKYKWRSARVTSNTILRAAFCAEVCFEAFLYLQFVFVTFRQTEIVEKAAYEMLVKSTTSIP